MVLQVRRNVFPYKVNVGNATIGIKATSSIQGLPTLTFPVSAGEYFDGTICYVRDWTTLFMQLPGAREVLEKIQTFFESKSIEHFGLMESAVKGSLGVVQFDHSEEFFRVIVLERKSPIIINVLFVDYGNIEEIDRRIVHELAGEMKLIPAQAIPINIKHSTVGHRMRFDDFRDMLQGAEISLLMSDTVVKGRFAASIFTYGLDEGPLALDEVINSKQPILKVRSNRKHHSNGSNATWLPPIARNETLLLSTTSGTSTNGSGKVMLLADYSGQEAAEKSPIFTARDGIWMAFATVIVLIVIGASYILLCLGTRCAQKVLRSKRTDRKANTVSPQNDSKASVVPIPDYVNSPARCDSKPAKLTLDQDKTKETDDDRAKAGKSLLTLQTIPNMISLISRPNFITETKKKGSQKKRRILDPIDPVGYPAVPGLTSSLNSEPVLYEYADSVHPSDYDIGFLYAERKSPMKL
ncbi:hypothetical protein QR680_018331 [Steinernema hermaphroditum]|uniref:Tudor domain-containing protein n=1 Tax=Steinernema hermaphroditum TaxID=289476 RepID=A0AA39LQK6_9BILA|nr:hypothetical protein QR680_018331 [Steinernema hermaphroditum]